MFDRMFTIPRQCIAILGVAIFMALCASTVHAQRFQWNYGTQDTAPRYGTGGQNGVQRCQFGGYISVGSTHDSSTYLTNGVGNWSASIDVYILRTDSRGTPMWQRRIDFYIYTSPGVSYSTTDSATSVRECANGDFIITGFSLVNHTDAVSMDFFLIRLSPNGSVIWARHYGDEELYEYAFDVIETTTGPTTGQFRKGDFVVAGFLQHGTDNPNDAMLYRIRSDGTPLWQKTYRQDESYDERFYALDECTYGVASNALSDIVAVGKTEAYSLTSDAWVVRVDPSTGGFTGGNHGVAAIDAGGDEIFYAVDELTVGAGTSNIVAAGSTTGRAFPSSDKEVLVVATDANPSQPLVANRVFGDDDDQPDVAYGIKQITVSDLNVGNIVVTGMVNLPPWPGGPGFGSSDGFLQELTPALSMVGDITLYGDTAVNILYSVNEVPEILPTTPSTTPGFILCGTNRRDTGYAAAPVHWLIKTDANKSSYCNSAEEEISHEIVMLTSDTTTPPTSTNPGTWDATYLIYEEFWGDEICFQESLAREKDPNSDNDGVSSVGPEDISIISGVNLSPNPIHAGGAFKLGFSAATPGTANVVISDVQGNIVARMSSGHRAGDVDFTVNTRGWAAGAYIIRIETEGRVVATRAIILD